MVMTASTMMALSTPAPDFCLPSTSGENVSLSDFADAKLLAVLFICNHCPYVKHIAPALSELAKLYSHEECAFVAINSNDIVAYPEDDMAHMIQEKAERDYNFPYLLDETQSVAKAYQAACTPDIFVFDQDRKLAYRGQFDDTRPHRISSGNYDSSQTPATGQDLQNAIDQLLAGEALTSAQVPSMGCNIKWKVEDSLA